MNINKINSLIIGGLLASSLSMAAIANPPVGTAHDMHSVDSMKGGKFDAAESKKRWSDYLNKLHAELKITPEQESSWKNYSDSIMKQHDAWVQDFEVMRKNHDKTMSAPDRMKARVEMAENNLSHLKAQADKLDDLYKELSPEQKKIADSALAMKHAKKMKDKK